ncbi:MAG TPA: hypothetical protein VH062_02065 [Polyangiaceae bacterium]|nr:hypothetical protein [Polyangiaceae bacterium]
MKLIGFSFAALLLVSCGARTNLGEAVSDGPQDGAVVVGAGGFVGTGGVSVVLPPGSGGARPLGSGGSRPSAGGFPTGAGGHGAGGVVVGAGGFVGAGGTTIGSGGQVMASGGTVGAGGAIEPVDAGPNYCDPAIQCAGRKCRGVIDCGHLQQIDCSQYVTCASDEYCRGLDFLGYCTSVFAGLGCGPGGAVRICVGSTCEDCTLPPEEPGCATPDNGASYLCPSK